jgi:polyisoprenoid-binding protein YceI
MDTPRATRGPTEVPPLERLERWEIDPSRSTLEFSLRHLVIQEIRGRFNRWGGTLIVDRADPSRSRVDVWVELGSLDTGEAERDAHVRSPEFFDVDKFPRARFYSTAVESSDERIRVRGNLQLHGMSRELEIEVLPGTTSGDADGVLRSLYTGHAVINRQAFGLRWNQDLDWGGVVVGDRVELSIKAALHQGGTVLAAQG